MPIAKVQLPDGRIGRFEVPEGTTPEQVLEHAKSMQDIPAAPAESSPAVAFLNSGIAKTLGAPVDLANAALGIFGLDSEQPTGGSESIASLMRKGSIGPRQGEQPQSLGAQIMQGVGEAAGGVLPMGAVAKGASALSGIAGNIGRSVTESVAAHPILSSIMDLASGVGSGVGGAVGEMVAQGSDAAKAVGQVTGGVAVPMSIGSIVKPVQLAVRGIKAAAFPYTNTGATIRAANRVQSLVPDPAAAAAMLDNPTITNLTPAQRIGDERLLALQNAVTDKNVMVDDALKQSNQSNIDTLTGEVGKIRGEGNISDTQQHIGGRQEELSKLLDERLQVAKEKTDSEIARISPEMRGTQSSLIARNELESALSDARTQEKHLWNDIPDNILVDKKNTTDTYNQLIKNTPRAQQEDIPKNLMAKVLTQPEEPAIRIYNERGEPMIGDMPVTERVSELQGLRSKLLEGSRKARAEGNYNSARIHDDLADAVLNDIGAAPERVQGEIGQKLRDALDFSRTLNEKFTRGEVGKILGTSRTGGDKVAPELTLGRLIGAGKAKGDVGLQNMLDAADTPELRGSVEDYLKEQLNKTAMKNGSLNSSAAKKFMDDNVDILDKFPELKKSISTASEAADKLAVKSTRTKQVQKTLVSDSKNQVSKFINAPIDKEFDVILGSRDPAGFTKDLVNRASKDPSGAAAKGLKASAVDYVMKKSQQGASLHGESLLNNLNGNPRMSAALEQVLTPEEMQRLRRIGGELKAAQANTNKDVGGVINDLPHALIATPLRIYAAKIGAAFGKGTDGASLITANIFSQRVKQYLGKWTNDKAHNMLTQAVQDPQLMKALLTDTTTKPGQKAAAQKLEAWLLGPGASLIDAGDDKKNK